MIEHVPAAPRGISGGLLMTAYKTVLATKDKSEALRYADKLEGQRYNVRRAKSTDGRYLVKKGKRKPGRKPAAKRPAARKKSPAKRKKLFGFGLI